jgi:hypothetical protein
MHYFIGSGSLHLMAKRPRLSLALAALLVGGMYRGHRMVHAAAAAPVQVSASKVLPPRGFKAGNMRQRLSRHRSASNFSVNLRARTDDC